MAEPRKGRPPGPVLVNGRPRVKVKAYLDADQVDAIESLAAGSNRSAVLRQLVYDGIAWRNAGLRSDT